MRPNFKRKSNLNSAIARLLFMAAIFLCGPRLLPAQASFINWETPPVHPIDLSPDGQHLAVCNLPNGRVEIFNMSSGVPISESVIQVGLDPVTARWRTNSELWVVNLISDSISVVDLPTRTILDTILTSEEPQDVAFVTGSPDRAFVSCSHDNRIQIYNATTRAFIQNLTVAGEEPRALAVSPDGSKVYVAIFESGNGSTLLGGGADADGSTVSFPPNVVNLASGPYNGKNPPSNTSGGFNDTFNPPLNPALAIRQKRFWPQGNSEKSPRSARSGTRRSAASCTGKFRGAL
ncbi:beta-propeller fold lactonase family protein [Candidatus Sumerlaeota bacterium]|nr:beta-propeller fold lactonase family protein [Candidatus Sumerlaeota bacterium]